jgi:hypothetical protein
MRFYRLPLVVLCASSIFLTASPAESTAEGKSSGGVWHSVVGGLKAVGDGAGAVAKGAEAVAKTATGAVTKVFDFSGPKRTGLKLDLVCASNPVRLGKGTPVAVKLQLFNMGKKTQLLEFASGQRAEMVVRDSSGKIVGRSLVSTGEEAGVVTLNPRERIEFLLQLPTKELVAGKTYSLEAAITGQAGLVAKMPMNVAP